MMNSKILALKIASLGTLPVLVSFLFSCSTSPDDRTENTKLIKREIALPFKYPNGPEAIVWYNDSSYLALTSDSFKILKFTPSKIDTLRGRQLPLSRNSYEGFRQTLNGSVILIDVYAGVYLISDSIRGYPLPKGSRPGVSSASTAEDGSIYACGVAGVWQANQRDSALSVSPLNKLNTHALYIDDSIGITSRQNVIDLFRGGSVTKTINFIDIGLAPSAISGYWTDWIGKMNGNYYVFQGESTGVKITSSGNATAIHTPPSAEIISFTDGDCFFAKRMDLSVWCDDGKNTATFTKTNSDLDDEMMFAGKNSEGYWISDGTRLLLLDTETAKRIARAK